jgi:hypothetical protein
MLVSIIDRFGTCSHSKRCRQALSKEARHSGFAMVPAVYGVLGSPCLIKLNPEALLSECQERVNDFTT